MQNIFNHQNVKVRSERIVFVEVNRILCETRICSDAYGILRSIVEIFRYYMSNIPEDVLEYESKLLLKDEIPFSKQDAMSYVYELAQTYDKGFTVDMVEEFMGSRVRFYLSDEQIHVKLNSCDFLSDLKKDLLLNKNELTMTVSNEFFLLLLMEGLNSDMKSKKDIQEIVAAVDRSNYYDFFNLRVISKDEAEKKELIDGRISFPVTGMMEEIIAEKYGFSFNLISVKFFHMIAREVSQFSIYRVVGRFDERGLVSSIIKNRLSVLKSNSR